MSPTTVLPQENIPYFTPANNAGAAVNPTDPKTPTLFQPLRIRDLTLKNRIMAAPMCMYSAESNPSSPAIGALTDYHITHLGHIALKGAGLVMVEATAVQPNGRISPNDSGLWQEGGEQVRGLKRVVDFVHSQGGAIAVQLAHAGRKASVVAPWLAQRAGKRSLRADEGARGWPADVVGPSGGEEEDTWAGDEGFWAPRELSTGEVEEIVAAFAKSAALAVEAGADALEIHGAHGYLICEFLSPVTNRRTDKYGGSFENRIRIVSEIAAAVRAVIPPGMPLFLRISATEWLDHCRAESWDLASSIELAKLLPSMGIDFLDVSSGGNNKEQRIDMHNDYQVDLAGQIRKEIRAAGQTTLVGAVGYITQADKAREIVQGADRDQEALADAVLIGRQFLREPEWVMNAAKKLDVKVTTPWQFGRAL